MIMKELSIEEKAKAYDKALEKTQKWYDVNTNAGYRAIFEEIFPELKESDDERIRKELIEYFRWNVKQILNDFSNKECIAWLEKHRYTDIALENEYWRGYDDAKKEKGEQEPVEFKPSFRVGDVIKPKDPVLGEPRIIVGIHPKLGYETNNGILDFEFEDNWELVEQKPAWSEEDEKMFEHIIAKATLHFSSINYLDEEEINFLKSLKDRVQPQLKQEWSEEDDKMINSIAVHLNATTCGFPKERAWADRFMNWLKSLRP